MYIKKKKKTKKNAVGLPLQRNHCLCAHFGVLVFSVGVGITH